MSTLAPKPVPKYALPILEIIKSLLFVNVPALTPSTSNSYSVPPFTTWNLYFLKVVIADKPFISV
jgi:hypothetical protein